MIYRAIIVTPGQPTVGQCVITTYPKEPPKGHTERRRLDAASFKVPKR
jgi:hypothetical protein